MKCPACENILTEITMGRLSVDVCRGGCGGIWFDNFELQQADDPWDFAGAVLEDLEKIPRVTVDFDRRRHCPRCGDLVLMRHFYSDQRRIQIDTCPGCGGVWLDHGELLGIRHECAAKPDKNEAAQNYFQTLFAQDWQKTRKRV
jgi:uncharacterized protein